MLVRVVGGQEITLLFTTSVSLAMENGVEHQWIDFRGHVKWKALLFTIKYISFLQIFPQTNTTIIVKTSTHGKFSMSVMINCQKDPEGNRKNDEPCLFYSYPQTQESLVSTTEFSRETTRHTKQTTTASK